VDKHADQQRVFVRRILDRYVSENPEACDTIEGIRRWWTADMDTDMLTIERVLEEMVEAGTLQRIRLSSEVVVYRRNAGPRRDGD